MVDRWESRPDPEPGQGILYWHMLVGDNPAVQTAVAAGRERLGSFRGLHFTPGRWLHITTFVAGPADSYSNADIEQMVDAASKLLSAVPPVTVSLESVLYHPEAIVLRVEPAEALDRVRAAVESATRAGGVGTQVSESQLWIPHVTLAYSTAEQEAAPIIEALGRSIPGCELTLDRISLVVQEGPERLWNWRPIAEVPFGAPRPSARV